MSSLYDIYVLIVVALYMTLQGKRCNFTSNNLTIKIFIMHNTLLALQKRLTILFELKTISFIIQMQNATMSITRLQKCQLNSLSNSNFTPVSQPIVSQSFPLESDLTIRLRSIALRLANVSTGKVSAANGLMLEKRIGGIGYGQEVCVLYQFVTVNSELDSVTAEE